VTPGASRELTACWRAQLVKCAADRLGAITVTGFEEVFAGLYGFARMSSFRTDEEDYLIHITMGTHVQQICFFLLAESRHLPGRLLQTSPPPRDRAGTGTYRLIDLDLSKYDALANLSATPGAWAFLIRRGLDR